MVKGLLDDACEARTGDMLSRAEIRADTTTSGRRIVEKGGGEQDVEITDKNCKYCNRKH